MWQAACFLLPLVASCQFHVAAAMKVDSTSETKAVARCAHKGQLNGLQLSCNQGLPLRKYNINLFRYKYIS